MNKHRIPRARSVSINFLMNTMLTVSAFIFPLITFPYVSRVLGAAGNGKISFAVSIISYFSMFAQLGIPTYGIKVCAACRDDKRKLNQTVQELLIINTFSVAVVYVLFAISVLTIPKFQNYRLLLIITSVTILLDEMGIDWLFQALEQYSYITIRNVAFKVVSIILMFAFVHKASDYILYGAISVFATCGSNVWNMIYASRFLDHRPLGHYKIKRHIKPIFDFFMLSVSISVYTSLDTVMLGFMTNNAEVGYYTAATKIRTILASLSTALGRVLMPRISNYVANGKTEQFADIIKKSFKFTLLITIAVTIYFFVMADATIDLLAGRGYDKAVIPMRILMFTVILIGLSSLTGMQILIPSNRENCTTISTMAGAAVNLAVNAVAIPHYAASGAAAGTVAAEVTVLAVQMVFVRKELFPMISGMRIYKVILSNFIAAILLITLKHSLPIENSFLQLAITSLAFFATYGLCLIAFREEFVLEYLMRFRTGICKRLRG